MAEPRGPVLAGGFGFARGVASSSGGGEVRARATGGGGGGNSSSGRGAIASKPWRTYRCVCVYCRPYYCRCRRLSWPIFTSHPCLTRPQDVLEDVTYMNAMSDDSPKPTKAWDLPDEAALAEFCGRELAADPQAFALEKICQNSLGFYLVRACVRSVMVWLW